MGMGFAPTWLRQVMSPPPALLHKTTLESNYCSCVSHWEHQWSRDYAYYSFPPSFIICMLGLMLELSRKSAKCCMSHKLESKLLAVPTLFSVVPFHQEGHHRKVEGHIKIFRTALCAGIL